MMGKGGFIVHSYEVECDFPAGRRLAPAAHARVLSRMLPMWVRRICCGTPSLECRGCLKVSGCPYAALFVVPDPAEIAGIPLAEEAALPFAVTPVHDDKGRFVFRVALAGSASAALEGLVGALQAMGEEGYGREKEIFKVRRVAPLGRGMKPEGNPASPRDAARLLKGGGIGIEGMVGDLSFQDMKAVTLRFIAPPVLPADRFGAPHFDALVRGIRDRVKALGLLYCGGEPGLQLRGLAAEAKGVSAGRVVASGGTLTVTYTGAMKDSAPLLRVGSHLNVGKSCAYGLGAFSVL